MKRDYADQSYPVAYQAAAIGEQALVDREKFKSELEFTIVTSLRQYRNEFGGEALLQLLGGQLILPF